MTDLQIDYSLLAHGWANFHLRYGDEDIIVGDFSYTTDALGDLVRAARLVLNGAESVTVRFDSEPAESRLVLDQPETTDMRLRILVFDDFYRPKHEESGAVIFEARADRAAFACAVQKAAHAALKAHGLKGYLESWGACKFPLADLQSLDRALAIDV